MTEGPMLGALFVGAGGVPNRLFIHNCLEKDKIANMIEVRKHSLECRYDIFNCNWDATRTVIQYTFTHKQYIEQNNRYKQYIEQHNRHKQYIEQHSSLIRKSADRAPSLRGISWY
jgi:hypothetical protein